LHTEQRVAVGVAALYLANITTLVLNTLFLVLLTNLVSVQEVGLVSLLNVIVVSVATVAVLALQVSGSGLSATPPAVTRFLAEYIGKGQGPARRVYLLSAGICGLVSVAIVGVISYPPVASMIAGPLDGSAVFFAGLDAIVFSFAQLGAYSMLGTGKATAAGKLIIASSALRYAAAAVLLVSGAGPSGVFIGFAGGDILLAVLGNASTFRAVGYLHPGGVDMKPVRRYMASVFFAAVVGLAVSQTDKLLAFFQQGLFNLAFYNVATVGAAVASFAPSAATNVLVPALSSYGDDAEKKRSMIKKYTRYITLTAMPMGFGLAALSPFLLRVFGDEYASAAPILSIISISIGLSSITAVYASSLLVDDRAHHFTLSSVLALAGLVVVAVLTVPVLGLRGVALGRGVMLFIMLGAVAFFVRRGGMLVLDTEAYAKSLGASAVMAAFIYGTLSLVQQTGFGSRVVSVVGSILMIPLGFAAYLVVMKVIKGFNQTDMDFIDALLPAWLRVLSKLARRLL